MEFINDFIVRFIEMFGRLAQDFWNNVTALQLSPAQIAFDIILVSILFYYLFVLLKGSRAVHIVLGLLVLVLIFLLSKAFSLLALGWLLERFFTIALVAIPIIFQPELRSMLERLGQPKWFRKRLLKVDRFMTEILEAVTELAHAKIGALIVFQQKIPLAEYAETGVKLHAELSKDLLMSIFQTKSPLHDGAVIIRDLRIEAAACLLPASQNVTHTHGTRHKAALGISESTDAKVIVVSEERGTISLAEDGHLESHVSSERLKHWLTNMLKSKK